MWGHFWYPEMGPPYHVNANYILEVGPKSGPKFGATFLDTIWAREPSRPYLASEKSYVLEAVGAKLPTDIGSLPPNCGTQCPDVCSATETSTSWHCGLVQAIDNAIRQQVAAGKPPRLAR